MLLNDEDLATVRESCAYVYIEENKSISFNTAKSELERDSNQTTLTFLRRRKSANRKPALSRIKRFFTGSSKKRPKRLTLEKALKPANANYQETNRLVKNVMNNIQVGKSIDTPAAKEAVEACVDNVMTNGEAMMLLTRLRNRDEYTSEHSLNVAITSIAFGRHLGMNREQLKELGMCGLLHDMGKMLTPEEVLNKPDRLTDVEMDIMRRHPVDGKEILLATQGVGDSAIDTAYMHHERKNRSGYPNGTGLDKLGLYTQMVSIVDAYDAMTGERCYKAGMTAEDALRLIYAGGNDMFDSALTINFINNVGLYPLGSVVELHTGEIGIVVATNETFRLRPKVRMILDVLGEPLKEQTIDLARPARDKDGEAYYIKRTHTPKSLKVDLSSHIAGYL